MNSRIATIALTVLGLTAHVATADLVLSGSVADSVISSGGSTTLTVVADGSSPDLRGVTSYRYLLAIVPQVGASGDLTITSYTKQESFTDAPSWDGNARTAAPDLTFGESNVAAAGGDFFSATPFPVTSLVSTALGEFGIAASAGALGTFDIYLVDQIAYTDAAGSVLSTFTDDDGPLGDPTVVYSFDNVYDVPLAGDFSGSTGSLLGSISAVPEASPTLVFGILTTVGLGATLMKRRRTEVVAA